MINAEILIFILFFHPAMWYSFDLSHSGTGTVPSKVWKEWVGYDQVSTCSNITISESNISLNESFDDKTRPKGLLVPEVEGDLV